MADDEGHSCEEPMPLSICFSVAGEKNRELSQGVDDGVQESRHAGDALPRLSEDGRA